jgi:hypothetical protein
LSAILKSEELQGARLVKIDVEGAEWSVVAGMESLIKGARPDLEIIIEVNPELLARRGKTPANLLKPFLSSGYHTYLLENDYSPQSYIPLPREKRPQRFWSPIQETVDLVLSREDTEYL